MKKVRDSEAEAAILQVTAERGPDKSACPTDVARVLDPVGWRSQLGRVRQAAVELVGAGQLEILRKGKPVEPEAVRGVIRLRIARGAATTE